MRLSTAIVTLLVPAIAGCVVLDAPAAVPDEAPWGHDDVCDRDMVLPPHSQDPATRPVISGLRVVDHGVDHVTFEWTIQGEFLCSWVDIPDRTEGSSMPEPQYGNGTFQFTFTGLRPGMDTIYQVSARSLDASGVAAEGHFQTDSTLPVGSPLAIAYTKPTYTNVVLVTWHILGGDGTERSWVEWMLDDDEVRRTPAREGQGRFTEFIPQWGDPAATVESHGYDGAVPGNYTLRVVAEDDRGRVLGREFTMAVFLCQPSEGQESWVACPDRDARVAGNTGG